MKSLILFLPFLITACSSKEGTIVDDNSAQTILNVSYGNNQRQKFDLYLPANRNTRDTRLLILVHGGGWVDGDKTDFNGYITELQRRLPDIAIANINYRLAGNNQNLFPAQENDVKDAVDFLLSKSDEYKTSKKIALLGASAGAHLSLLHAYKQVSPVPVKAVISFFGPTDLVSLYNSPGNASIPLLLGAVTGGTPSTKASLYEQSSPSTFVNAQTVPTLLLQGGNDPLVPFQQALLLKDKLAANNVVHQYVFYPAEGHGWQGTSLEDSFDKITTFLGEYFK